MHALPQGEPPEKLDTARRADKSVAPCLATPPEASDAGGLLLEVVLLWGGDVLSVAHYPLSGVFYLRGDGGLLDVALPPGLLPSGRIPIAVAKDGRLEVAELKGAKAFITEPTRDNARAQLLSVRGAPSGAGCARLLPGQRCHIQLPGELELQLAPVGGAAMPPRDLLTGLRSRDAAWLLGTSLALMVLSAWLLIIPPKSVAEAPRNTELRRIALAHDYLAASSRRESEGRELAGAREEAEPDELLASSEARADLGRFTSPSKRPPEASRHAQPSARRSFASRREAHFVRAPGGIRRQVPPPPTKTSEEGSREGIATFDEEPGAGLRRVLAVAPHLARLPERGSGGSKGGFGGDPEGDILRFIRPHVRRIGACYRAAARRSPSVDRFALEGRAALRKTEYYAHSNPNPSALARLVISGGGVVQEVSIENESDLLPVVEQCLKRVFLGLSFPPMRRDPSVVRYPLGDLARIGE